ncbi:MAG TPA: sigma-70 family RNA polymerase sigma factor [Candidatus Acidoferrales bacterium]|jgi:RNA polymerase sigma-70 factor (ECF subfamily)
MASIHATDSDKNSDLGLVAAAKFGDAKAFGELAKRYERKIFAVAKRMTKNREDAEDVVQESFLKAFVHLGAFQGNSQFSTWLTRIAMNEALMALRKKRRVREIFPARTDEDVPPATEVFVDMKPSCEESYLLKEREELLAGAVNELSAKSRQTILLHTAEGRSVEDVAKTLGISAPAAKSRLFHGYEKLRRKLDPELLWGVAANNSAAVHQV